MKSTSFIFSMVVSLLFISSTKLEAMMTSSTSRAAIRAAGYLKVRQQPSFILRVSQSNLTDDTSAAKKPTINAEWLENIIAQTSDNRKRILDHDDDELGEHETQQPSSQNQIKQLPPSQNSQPVNSELLDKDVLSRIHSELLTETEEDL